MAEVLLHLTRVSYCPLAAMPLWFTISSTAAEWLLITDLQGLTLSLPVFYWQQLITIDKDMNGQIIQREGGLLVNYVSCSCCHGTSLQGTEVFWSRRVVLTEDTRIFWAMLLTLITLSHIACLQASISLHATCGRQTGSLMTCSLPS